MDRNLGALQVATSSDDILAFGDLYQWGRLSDGHQIRTSLTTSVLSNSDVPLNSNFIITTNNSFDWRTPPNNNLWLGINGINNPCRIPTKEEFLAEASYWGNFNSAEAAFNSPLKLPLPGFRGGQNGTIFNTGSLGYYWWSRATTASDTSSTVAISINGGTFGRVVAGKANGFSVRCIKD